MPTRYLLAPLLRLARFQPLSEDLEFPLLMFNRMKLGWKHSTVQGDSCDQRQTICKLFSTFREISLHSVQGDNSICSKPPVDLKTKVPLWLGLSWPGKNGAFDLKSTGGFEQMELSPCTYIHLPWPEF